MTHFFSAIGLPSLLTLHPPLVLLVLSDIQVVIMDLYSVETSIGTVSWIVMRLELCNVSTSTVRYQIAAWLCHVVYIVPEMLYYSPSLSIYQSPQVFTNLYHFSLARLLLMLLLLLLALRVLWQARHSALYCVRFPYTYVSVRHFSQIHNLWIWNTSANYPWYSWVICTTISHSSDHTI